MIEIKNLNFEYSNGHLALKNINMKFDNKKIIGIIGENGAGKSTLFLNILGINKPTSGEILIDGEKLRYDNAFLKEYRKKINMVLQDPDKQIFYSEVYNDIAFGLKNLKLDDKIIEERIDHALKTLQISDLKHNPTHYLSYGQKKRVAIAGVIAMNPDVILMDEPTAGLDPRLTKQMKKTVQDLKNMDKTILVSSHDMNFIYEICDYIYIIHSGENVKEGNPQEVFLDEKIISEVGLEVPSLVKIHLHTDLPLFSTEEKLYEYIKNKN